MKEEIDKTRFEEYNKTKRRNRIFDDELLLFMLDNSENMDKQPRNRERSRTNRKNRMTYKNDEKMICCVSSIGFISSNSLNILVFQIEDEQKQNKEKN